MMSGNDQNAAAPLFSWSTMLWSAPPFLFLPDPDLPYEVVTDACRQGLGAMLVQASHPIAFKGRQLNRAAQNHTVQDMELLGVKYCCLINGDIICMKPPPLYLSSNPLLILHVISLACLL